MSRAKGRTLLRRITLCLFILILALGFIALKEKGDNPLAYSTVVGVLFLIGKYIVTPIYTFIVGVLSNGKFF